MSPLKTIRKFAVSQICKIFVCLQEIELLLYIKKSGAAFFL